MSFPTVYILTVCDCDPDRSIYGGACLNNRTNMVWNGVKTGIPSLFDFMRSSLDSYGQPLKIVWCVRCDEQLRRIYGVHRWAYMEFENLWEKLKNSGHEIAWHPHFWRWSERNAVWYQEKDSTWISNCLRNSYSDIPSNQQIKTVKTGWGYHCNESVATLDDLGIIADVSPVPTLRSESKMVGTELPLGAYDWSSTPKQPYHPSRDNYRISGIANYSLLFIPATIFRLPIHYLLGKQVVYRVQKAMGKRHNIVNRTDLAPMGPTKPTNVMKKTIRQIFKSARYLQKSQIIHSYFHSDELLRKSGTFSRRHFIEYYKLIGEIASEYNIRFSYVTANDLATIVGSQT